jgi:hypothetical protein
MALANYTDLTNAIANWMGRADLTSRLPEFVSLAESDFNRELRVAPMLVTNTAFPFAGEFVPLPSGFLEVRDFYLNVSPRRTLVFLPPDQQTDYFDASGCPKYYSIIGQQFRFAPIPNGSFTGTLMYWQSIPGLQANNVNWLMTAHPNLYLFATNFYASTYLQDAAKMQQWMAAYQAELESVKGADKKSRYGATGMAVRASGTVV